MELPINQLQTKPMAFSYRILLLLLFLCFTCTCGADRLGEYCGEDTNIGGNTRISSNIDALLAKLVSGTAASGYIATSYGFGQDKVFGLSQCRGDVSTKDCFSCIHDASKQIRLVCPDQADARIWYDYCFLRYSVENFVGKIDTSFAIFYFNVENVTDVEDFNGQLGALMDQVRAQAVQTRNEGLGTGETKLSPLVTLYALVQCTRDLSQIDCAQCVAIAVGNFPKFCDNRKGCRALYSSCYVRYELYPFFFPINSNERKDNTSMVVVHH